MKHHVFDSVNRRTLIAAGFGGLIGVLAPQRRLLAQPTFDRYPFSLGVASGEPSSDGVVLWTRIAPDPLNGGGMPMRPVPVRWEIASDDGMQRVLQQGEAIARPELAHSVHVEVSGLAPASEYWYRFYVGEEASQTGRTKTTPLAGVPVDQVRFGVAGCQRYHNGYFTAYRHLAQEHLDFVFHYGDYIYENPSWAPRRDQANLQIVRTLPEAVDEPYSLVDYRNRYAAYKADTDLQAAHESAPFLMSFDDHEVDNDWAGDLDQDATPPAVFLLRRAAAFQAYYEHMPLRLSSLPQGNQMLMYRRFDFGDLAQVNVLDTRQYRSDQPCGGGVAENCAAALEPDRTMLGTEQERWLLDGLGQSTARWNVLAQQVIMMRHDRNPDPAIVSTQMDKWDGAVAARQRLLSALEQNRVSNPIVLSGDIHNNWAGELKANFDDEDSRTLGHEFVSTSITSGGDGADQRRDTPEILSQNPHMKFFNNQRGYLSIEVTPERWRTHFRIVDYVSRPDAPIKNRATYVVEADRPGLQLG